MQGLKRTWIWLRRIRHCRGFGVQSPWAYRMVRYVINEHWPYYAYEDLRRRYPAVKSTARKLCELCLRLSNNVQPYMIINVDASGYVSGEYLKAGCRKAKYVEPDSAESMAQLMSACGDGALLVRLVPQDGLDTLFDTACRRARHGTVIMLQGIHEDAAARRLWGRTVKKVPHVVTFDLYYCGLIFFDDKRFKQNYMINF